ncbi:putative Fe-containing alcohol dehydrogenase [Patellaria atrata CBS 101060]|uniref:Fe-containing alcohol dehydrogenase n=1 Tax=Patellaria atrata CBS 101060 TaxID=1346257 RepID=A0A9P4S6V8_9PEZI|nr:putative Fe-containing alcohol dehydrogenase [Patellaria atrata CBS 101060]
MPSETYRLAIPSTTHPYISYGLPFPEACAKHVSSTLNASRVYIIASKSLSMNTDALERLRSALSDKVVGERVGMIPHTLWSEVLQVAEEVRDCKADLIVTLGAGSLTDAAKIVALAIANNAFDFPSLQRLANYNSSNPLDPSSIRTPTVTAINIPTSLSGGEYQDLAGGTHDETFNKHGFKHPDMGAKVVILDPKLAATTPARIWLSTGIRAVDHCVETICSPETNDEADEAAVKGLKRLVPGLLVCKYSEGKEDEKARLECMLGVIDAMAAVKKGVPLGASHGIGHQLGPLGVGHGETSCILLPAVCKFNMRHAAKDNLVRKQRTVSDALWGLKDVVQVLERRGLEREQADLGDLLDVVISELGMPRSLKDVGVGREKLDALARNSLDDKWCKTNAVPLTEKNQVMEILETVLE